MRDANGRAIKIGDRVRVSTNRFGRVVCDFDAGKFSPKFAREDWGYLKTGALIELDSGEVFHYPTPDEDFEIVPADRPTP